MSISYSITFVALSIILTQIGYSGVTQGGTGESVVPHWSFQRIERPSISSTGSGNSIDALLSSKWQDHGIEHVPPASDEVLLRRLYLDLIGLPPSPAVREEFLFDPTPDKTTKLVTKLLASPRHSEHWGRHWMDVWRYTDWYGLGDQLRYSQKHIWHWRDWILESLSSDKGYDQMVMEMLAGDELAPGNLKVARATGFLARNYFLFNRTTWLDSTIEHTSKAFLGLTINCAKCHDHKYDPVTQVDYYRLRAIFEPHQVRLDAVPGEINFAIDGIAMAFDDHPNAPTYLHIKGNEATPDRSNQIEPDIPKFFGSLSISPIILPADAWSPGTRTDVQQAHLDTARRTSPTAHAAMQARIAADNARFRGNADEATQIRLAKQAATLEWKADLERLQREKTLADRAAAKNQTEDTTKKADEARKKWEEMNKRGPTKEYSSVFGSRKALETPEHDFNTYGPTYSKISTGRRLALAKWITHRDNPLTARVAVNHLWLRTMGKPLVADMADFGHRAISPLHQNVLDYLAIELIENSWSLKHVLQLITSSRAYQRASSKRDATPRAQNNDPENHHYWRANGKRMTSQVLRDSVQACGEALDFRMGGPPVAHNEPTNRRSVYFRHSRDNIHRFHVPFDDANILECYRRQESIAPHQALALMNDAEVFAVSHDLAKRSLTDRKNRSRFLRDNFIRVLGRSPHNAEMATCMETLERLTESGSGEIEARTTVVLALFNHNDFITVR